MTKTKTQSKSTAKPAKSAARTSKRDRSELGDKELSRVSGGSPRDAASGLPTGKRT
jgi:hypothetical protein